MAIKSFKTRLSEIVSEIPTPWGVHCIGVDIGVGYQVCNSGNIIYLTKKEYSRQLSQANSVWKCPLCGRDAWWDDDNYSKVMSEN